MTTLAPPEYDLPPDPDEPPRRANPLDPTPAAHAAEQAVAGAALSRIDCAEAAGAVLDANGSQFASPALGAVYAAALTLAGSGARSISPGAVLRQMHRAGTAQMIQGNLDRLHDLAGRAAVGVEGTAFEAEIVAADAVRRDLARACLDGMQRAGDPAFDPALDLDAVISAVTAVGTGQQADQDLYARDHLAKLIDALKNPDQSPVLPSPWADLDRIVKLRPGKVVLIGARPGGGKSLAGNKIAAFAAVEHPSHYPAVVFSMEMPGPDVLLRITADLARVSVNKLDDGELTDADWQRIDAMTPRVDAAPLIVDDTSRLTIGHIRARLRWMAAEGIPAKYVVIDYVQLMQLDPAWGDAGWERLGGLSRELKILAGEFEVVVIGLVQLNRESEGRASKLPAMADLRGSGSFEQDADAVILLYQEPHPDDPSMLARAGEVDLIVEKNRNGPKSRISLAWQPHYGRMITMGGGL